MYSMRLFKRVSLCHFIYRRTGAPGALLGLMLLATPAGAAEFVPLGDLLGGPFLSVSRDVSDNGLVVTGISLSSPGERTSDLGGEAFRWTRDDGMTGLGFLGFGIGNTNPQSISSDGTVIVGTSRDTDGNTEAFTWEAGSGIEGMGFIDAGGTDGNFSFGRGISASGEIVVGGSSSTAGGADQEPFRWTELGGFEGLGGLPGNSPSGEALDITRDGSVVVGWASSMDTNPYKEGFRWTEATGMMPLGNGGFGGSEPRAVSDDGTTIAGIITGVPGFNAVAARWAESSGWSLLGQSASDPFQPDGNSNAQDITADGSTIVGYARDNGELHAVIWTETTGMRKFQEVLASEYALGNELDGWLLGELQAISGNGRFVAGAGFNPDGNLEAFLVDLEGATIPEPATATLLVYSIALTCTCYRRHAS